MHKQQGGARACSLAGPELTWPCSVQTRLAKPVGCGSFAHGSLPRRWLLCSTFTRPACLLPTWQNMWQGGSAMSVSAAGFQAESTRRRSFGFVFILWISSASCKQRRQGLGWHRCVPQHHQNVCSYSESRRQVEMAWHALVRNPFGPSHTVPYCPPTWSTPLPP